MKVTMLGAGSLGFTRRLVADILAVEELRDIEIALFDIDPVGLERIGSLLRKFVEENRLPTRIRTYTDRKAALEGARYAVSTVRVGGLEAFAKDIEIPLKYGVDQCVGDTLGPGGVFYALRTIPVLLDFCRDMREVCPDVLFINYSNPMAMNSWAVLEEGGVRYVGLCHGVQGSHRLLARVLGVPPEELDYVACGINHQTWFVKLEHKGRDMLPELLPAFRRHPEILECEPVRVDVLERFGYWSTESNGHLSEYLPWYRKDKEAVERWRYRGSWAGGETGGYLRACRQRWEAFDREYEELSRSTSRIKLGERSEEHGSYIIEALETGRPYRGCFNVRNGGLIPNLPPECVVEVPCWVDRTGIHPVRVGPLPAHLAAPLRWSVTVQELAVRAALTGDRHLVKMAVLHDPLTAACCDTETVWRMVDEMFEAEAEWLPQFRPAEAG